MSNILLGVGIVLMFIIIALLADARSQSKRRLDELKKANETTQLVIVTLKLIRTELVQALQGMIAGLDALMSEVQSASGYLATAIRDARRHDEAVAAYQRAIELVAQYLRVHWPVFSALGLSDRLSQFNTNNSTESVATVLPRLSTPLQ
jgi:hypothetical protein